jgi:hypothetical protein
VPDGDAVATLKDWFRSLGVDPVEDPATTAQKLRSAARRHPGTALNAQDAHSVRIGTDHPEPDHLVRTALQAPAERLGPGTGIGL